MNINSILKIRRLPKYFKALIFPIMLFSISSCFETQEEDKICEICISPPTYLGYTNIFTEEFNSVTLDEKWEYIEGNGCPDECGWGLSEELQYDKKDNVEVKDGNLRIIAKNESFGENLYTSGRITTFDTFSFTYGRIDVRAKLPKGQGIWPAIWLLGDNKELRWPTPGHISLMEMRGGEIDGRNNSIIGKLIWGTPDKVETLEKSYSLKNGIFNDQFHVFSIIWEPTKIQWLLNDKVYFESELDASMNETFNKKFHLNIKLAVGGRFPGNPDNSTVFPQELVIDYIRIFQKQN
jgi:beta-glucanase (GH16 family)